MNKLSQTLIALINNYETPEVILREAIQEEQYNGTDMANVYVVYGYSGSHSDYREWNITAYLIKEEAEAHLKQLTDWLVVYNVRRIDLDPWDEDRMEEWVNTSCPDKENIDKHSYDLGYNMRTIPLKSM